MIDTSRVRKTDGDRPIKIRADHARMVDLALMSEQALRHVMSQKD
jgi:hypothetical protein